MSYILAIDQGTSGTKTLLFDETGKPFARGTEPLQTSYLDNGHVEQDPEEIIQNVLTSVKKCLDDFKSKGGDTKDIKACGISNQRETFLVWDEKGQPLYNAVVWQCKRSVDICRRWDEAGYNALFRETTGLLIDPYFSGSKLLWLYENNNKVRSAIDKGNAYFGTIDTWLLYRLTGGKSYYTDYTNASRTMLFNLQTLQWDTKILETIGLSHINLPQPQPSSFLFGDTDFNGLLNTPIPITGAIGDSHAAAFGEGCFTAGSAKATLGTGCSILMNTGTAVVKSGAGMVSTICWSTESNVQYALEGVIVSCGATIEWLKNDLGLFAGSKETAHMAESVNNNGGVYLVPAFSGMGAPHWKMDQKAFITGLTFSTNKNHLVRAALESIPYQIKDVIAAMESDTHEKITRLQVNGGMTSNTFVMQMISDLLETEVATIGMPDVSALGAAYMAGLKAGIYRDLEHLSNLNSGKKIYAPSGNKMAHEGYKGWIKALSAME